MWQTWTVPFPYNKYVYNNSLREPNQEDLFKNKIQNSNLLVWLNKIKELGPVIPTFLPFDRVHLVTIRSSVNS